MASTPTGGPPGEFPFPFPPYGIQKDFMRQLYAVLEVGGLGIFESPTGTGKSMSLICGALTWFNQRERQRPKLIQDQIAAIERANAEEGDGDDWIAAESRKRDRSEALAGLRLELTALAVKAEKIEDLRRRRKVVKRENIQKTDAEFEELFRDLNEVREAVKRELAAQRGVQVFDEEEEAVIIDEYKSDDEDGSEPSTGLERRDFALRIFYCSRTHSQLGQFVKEVQKSPFAADIRLVSLASRQVTCIHADVKRLPTNALINERCLDMQKPPKTRGKGENPKGQRSKAAHGSCPYFKPGNIALLRDQSLLQVMDIEETIGRGKQLQACPYYASRHAVEDAQIVVLPYNSLLHKPTRDALGISLKDSVVIVDEAHNLLETIAHIHSIEISGKQLKESFTQLRRYKERYRARLKAKNLLYIKQILFILANLVKVIGGKIGEDGEQSIKLSPRLIEAHQLMNEAAIYNLNIFKLIKYVHKSNIAQKLHGFAEKFAHAAPPKQEPQPAKGVKAFLLKSSKKEDPKAEASPTVDSTQTSKPSNSTRSPLHFVIEFLQSLVATSTESRILVNSQPTLGTSTIKFCLLNPASQFQDLVENCHSVIVAGGTMQPTSEFRDQLFVSAGADLERIHQFSCGHVIPKENMLPLALGQGPSGVALDFRFGHRDDPSILDELYRILRNVINVIPGGVVCFFPSYDYENKVFAYFEQQDYVRKIEVKKQMFREPKRSDMMERVLREYSARAQAGAILFCVVGGKMSEGINFNDHLGRCVVMVGLPFPNAHSLELKEKMKYLDRTVQGLHHGRSGGQVHYENLCMKAVNQSIGRAIRHKDDFASLLLLDRRYQSPHIQAQLPGWIQPHVVNIERFPTAMPRLSRFFKRP